MEPKRAWVGIPLKMQGGGNYFFGMLLIISKQIAKLLYLASQVRRDPKWIVPKTAQGCLKSLQPIAGHVREVAKWFGAGLFREVPKWFDVDWLAPTTSDGHSEWNLCFTSYVREDPK
jgi:hypothetical protein